MKRLTRLLLIQEEEFGHVLYFLLFFIILGAGLAIGRASADALFLKRYGIEYLPLAFLGLSLFLGLSSVIYATVVDYLPAETFFRGILTVLAVLLLASWACITYFPLSGIYPFYYLIHKVAAELLLVHAALYVNQNFNALQSKRLSSVIFAGAELGALSGAVFTSASAGLLGVQNLLLIWLGLAIIAILLLSIRHGRSGPSAFYRAQRRSRDPVHGAFGQLQEGMVFVWRSPLLKYTALSLLCLVFTFYVLTYSVNRVYTETFESEETLAAFLAILIAVNSFLTLLIQVFITNRGLLRYGVQRMNLIFPATTVASYIGLISHFGLPTALLGSFNRDTMIEAIHKPVRSLFFNAVPQYMQGRARAVTVALVLPLGLIICGITLWLMQQFDHPLYFLAPGLLAALGFFYYNQRMNQAYGHELIETLKERVFVPGRETAEQLRAGGETLLLQLAESLQEHDPLFRSHAARIITGFPEYAGHYLLPELGRVDAATADWLIGQLLPLRPPGMADAVRSLLTHDDEHLQSTALRALVALDDTSSEKQTDAALHGVNPRLQAAAIEVMVTRREPADHPPALQTWKDLLQGTNQQQLAALSLFTVLDRVEHPTHQEVMHDMQASTLHLLQQEDPSIVLRALLACRHAQCVPFPGLGPIVTRRLSDSDPSLRSAAVHCAGLLEDRECNTCLQRALEDGHANVRQAAIDVMAARGADLSTEIFRWLAKEDRGNPRAQRTLLDAGIHAGMPATRLKQLAIGMVQEAIRLRDARMQILRINDASTSEQQLMAYVLDERYRDTVDLVLQALEPLHEAGLIGVIRAGIRSGDTRFVASACEALSTLHNEPAAQQLSRMLQEYQGDTSDVSLFTSPLDALQWYQSWTGDLLGMTNGWKRTLSRPKEAEVMSTLRDRILLLKQTSLFSAVDTGDLRYIADALEESEYFAGERAFDIGEQGDQLFIIVDGRIGISVSPDAGAQEFIRTLGPGQHFGEMNLIDDLPRSATAHVIEQSRLLSLEKGRLRGFIMSYPEISLGIMRGLTTIVRECATGKQSGNQDREAEN